MNHGHRIRTSLSEISIHIQQQKQLGNTDDMMTSNIIKLYVDIKKNTLGSRPKRKPRAKRAQSDHGEMRRESVELVEPFRVGLHMETCWCMMFEDVSYPPLGG